MLCKLGLEVCFEAFRVRLRKRDWGSNIEVVEKVGNMQKHRVAGLMLHGRLVEFKARRRVALTSVTPNSLMVVFPPCSVPSSASICWKQRLSVFSSKSCKGGLSHCWSFSEFCCFNPLISCVSFSSTSSSNWLFGWLEPVFVPFWLSLSLFDGEDPASSFRLFAVFGEGMGRLALRWAFVESASTLLGGGRVAAGIVKNCDLYVSSGRAERVSSREGAGGARHKARWS